MARTAMEVAIFDWVDHNPNLSLAEVYDRRLEMLELAEELGYYAYHVAEHHSTPLCVAASPNVWLAAASQRTSRIRLGPLVLLLPLYDPLRLIEEICTIDQLSHGRLELGVGRGVSPHELAGFGVDPAESRAIFMEALEVILQGLTNSHLDYEGKYYRYRDVPLPYEPFQKPYPPLWYPTSNAESMPWVAREGLSTMVTYQLSDIDEIGRRFAAYAATQRELAGQPGRLNGHVASPWYGITRPIYVAETDEEALAVARPAQAHFFASFNYLWALRSDRRHANDGNFDELIAKRSFVAGSPDAVRRIVSDLMARCGGNYFAGAFCWGSLTPEQVNRSLRLFATEVMPALKESSLATRSAV
jgi:alkanesulfonate monooxygenase SsuD/methylene tetrahydromethanopterin reductase-like flavin-dependent oxidoreductase (luciferase family)